MSFQKELLKVFSFYWQNTVHCVMFCCKSCHKDKNEDQFHRRSDSPRGHSSICAACSNERSKRRSNLFDPKAENHFCRVCEEALEYGVNWYSSHARSSQMRCKSCSKKHVERDKQNNSERWICHNARYRARKYKIPFNIDVSDIIIPDVCPVIGLKLEPGIGKLHDGSPTLDRIIPELGYVKGNVLVISHKANRMKNNGSLEELKKVVAWLEHLTA